MVCTNETYAKVIIVLFFAYIQIHFHSLMTSVDGFCSWFYQTTKVSTQQKDNTTRLVIYKYQNHELIQMTTNIPVSANLLENLHKRI